MNTSEPIIQATKGDTVCRPTDWIDIFRLFLLNYGLHALSVVPNPGDSSFVRFSRTVLAVFLPMTGALRALDNIFQYARGEKDPLTVALGAGALCMIEPGVYQKLHLTEISTALTEIHGQHALPVDGVVTHVLRKRHMNDELNVRRTVGHLIQVPQSLDIAPPLPEDAPNDQPGGPPLCQVGLACNYSILKGAAAIIQTLYASFELYRVSGEQIKKFGYASYSLTVIPYIMMSLLNLMANMCVPDYPRVFLVKYGGLTHPGNPDETTRNYGGEQGVYGVDVGIDDSHRRRQVEQYIGGDVGIAYGSLDGGHSDPGTERPSALPGLWTKWSPGKMLTSMIVYVVLLVCWMAGPYVLIKLLTNFEKAKSTTSQRAWTMAWLVLGQLLSTTPDFLPGHLLRRRVDPVKRHLKMLFQGTLFSVAAIGGFVVVIQMMFQDQACTRI